MPRLCMTSPIEELLKKCRHFFVTFVIYISSRLFFSSHVQVYNLADKYRVGGN